VRLRIINSLEALPRDRRIRLFRATIAIAMCLRRTRTLSPSTLHFQAPGFYLRQGSEVAARIECEPPSHTRFYMTKKLRTRLLPCTPAEFTVLAFDGMDFANDCPLVSLCSV
jgi:hypothetical protein